MTIIGYTDGKVAVTESIERLKRVVDNLGLMQRIGQKFFEISTSTYLKGSGVAYAYGFPASTTCVEVGWHWASYLDSTSTLRSNLAQKIVEVLKEKVTRQIRKDQPGIVALECTQDNWWIGDIMFEPYVDKVREALEEHRWSQLLAVVLFQGYFWNGLPIINPHFDKRLLQGDQRDVLATLLRK